MIITITAQLKYALFIDFSDVYGCVDKIALEPQPLETPPIKSLHVLFGSISLEI